MELIAQLRNFEKNESTLSDMVLFSPFHMQCVTHFVKHLNRCSQCSQNVTTDNVRYCEFVETLERLFPETPHLLTETTDAAPEDANPTISVFMLGGDSTVFEYQPSMTVKQLKLFVKERLGTSPEKQRLLFRDQELKVSLSYTPSLSRFLRVFTKIPELTKAYYKYCKYDKEIDSIL